MAKQMTTDEESILKRQARRRLIGAIALATAVVVTLPTVFDSEPQSTAVNDIELRIPDKDKAIAFQSTSSVSVTPVLAPAPASATIPASAVLPTLDTAAIVAAPVVAAAVARHAHEEKVAPVQTEVVKAAPPEHKAEPKPVVTHAVVPHSGYVVQVGAFSNAEAAKKLQEKLVAQGLPAYSEKVGANVRVRVGGYTTHAAAEKVRHKLEQQGLHPNVLILGN